MTSPSAHQAANQVLAGLPTPLSSPQEHTDGHVPPTTSEEAAMPSTTSGQDPQIAGALPAPPQGTTSIIDIDHVNPSRSTMGGIPIFETVDQHVKYADSIKSIHVDMRNQILDMLHQDKSFRDRTEQKQKQLARGVLLQFLNDYLTRRLDGTGIQGYRLTNIGLLGAEAAFRLLKTFLSLSLVEKTIPVPMTAEFVLYVKRNAIQAHQELVDSMRVSLSWSTYWCVFMRASLGNSKTQERKLWACIRDLILNVNEQDKGECTLERQAQLTNKPGFDNLAGEDAFVIFLAIGIQQAVDQSGIQPQHSAYFQRLLGRLDTVETDLRGRKPFQLVGELNKMGKAAISALRARIEGARRILYPPVEAYPALTNVNMNMRGIPMIHTPRQNVYMNMRGIPMIHTPQQTCGNVQMPSPESPYSLGMQMPQKTLGNMQMPLPISPLSQSNSVSPFTPLASLPPEPESQALQVGQFADSTSMWEPIPLNQFGPVAPPLLDQNPTVDMDALSPGLQASIDEWASQQALPASLMQFEAFPPEQQPQQPQLQQFDPKVLVCAQCLAQCGYRYCDLCGYDKWKAFGWNSIL